MVVPLLLVAIIMLVVETAPLGRVPAAIATTAVRLLTLLVVRGVLAIVCIVHLLPLLWVPATASLLVAAAIPPRGILSVLPLLLPLWWLLAVPSLLSVATALLGGLGIVVLLATGLAWLTLLRGIATAAIIARGTSGVTPTTTATSPVHGCALER